MFSESPSPARVSLNGCHRMTTSSMLILSIVLQYSPYGGRRLRRGTSAVERAP